MVDPEETLSDALEDGPERRLIALAYRARRSRPDSIESFLYFSGAQPALSLPRSTSAKTDRHLMTPRAIHHARQCGWRASRIVEGWQYWYAVRTGATQARFKAYIAIADHEFEIAFPYLFELIVEGGHGIALKYPSSLASTRRRCDRLIVYFDTLEGLTGDAAFIANGIRHMTAATVPFGGRTGHRGIQWGLDVRFPDRVTSWRRFVTFTLADAILLETPLDAMADRLLSAGINPRTWAPCPELISDQAQP
jgi:hypothetical protein